MQRQKSPSRLLDLGNSLNVQALLRFALHHALNHTVHVTNGWREDIDAGCLDELSRFFGGAEALELALNGFMNLRAGSYIANLSFHKHCRIDGLNCLDRFLRARDILLERQGRKVDNDCVKARFRRVYCLGE